MTHLRSSLLVSAVLLSLSAPALAADPLDMRAYDDRWYVTGQIGVLNPDQDRLSGNSALLGVGVGKMVSPHVSLDLELEHASPDFDPVPGVNWNLTSLSLTGRYHFNNANRRWHPYAAAGLGMQRTSLDGFDSDTSPFAKLGAGIQVDVSNRVDLRFEAGKRFSLGDNDYGSHHDAYASVAVVVSLGREAAPVAASPIACNALDEDQDGVNNCQDQCPASAAGTVVSLSSGCPVPLVIDLRGVNFATDKSVLNASSIRILDDAVDLLKKYDTLQVEVAGHTDSQGSADYNLALSERRARAVYDYLTAHGVDARRLSGPNGYGETRPIDTNDTAEGRAHNRRTELNAQD